MSTQSDVMCNWREGITSWKGVRVEKVEIAGGTACGVLKPHTA